MDHEIVKLKATLALPPIRKESEQLNSDVRH
jgi:hypothetical protein